MTKVLYGNEQIYALPLYSERLTYSHLVKICSYSPRLKLRKLWQTVLLQL